MTQRKRLLLICAMVLVMLLGIAATLYPILAAQYSESVRSEVRTQYKEIIEDTNDGELAGILSSAQDYNRKLFSGEIERLAWEDNGYFNQLRVPNTQVMCYVRIPKIDVDLPIYHGTDATTLNQGGGHLEVSSLPVGGLNTHAVISAHSGMAESRMFTDLELLEPGDVFYIDVLAQSLVYQIQSEDDIKVVLPTEVSDIQILQGEDLVTLITCTPYGVNSHRLLVRGHRIEINEQGPDDNSSLTSTENETAQGRSLWLEYYYKSIITGICASLLLMGVVIIVIIVRRRKRFVPSSDPEGDRDA